MGTNEGPYILVLSIVSASGAATVMHPPGAATRIDTSASLWGNSTPTGRSRLKAPYWQPTARRYAFTCDRLSQNETPE